MNYNFKENRKQEYADAMTIVMSATHEEKKEFYEQINDALSYYSLATHRDFGLCTHFPFDYLHKCLFQRVLDCLNYTSGESAYKFKDTNERVEFLECFKTQIEQLWTL
ncbi:MAG: hypothetical protein ACRCZ9_03090 [Fusobacteriaceae bacterium]